jgi:5'-phosphate synthase pdxT subunit
VTVGILALQGAFREHGAVLDRLGVAHRQVRKAADLEGLQAIIIPGGESTTIGLLMQEYGLFDPLRRGDIAVLGTCAGMILMAREIVGSDQPRLDLLDIAVERNAYGRQRESFEDDLQVEGMGAVRAVFIRAPYVVRVGEGVEVLSRDRAGHVIAVRSGRHMALAFHPELAGETRLHAAFLAGLRDAAPVGA